MRMNMQKLERRNTYTPTDAPQVRSNCDLVLNKEETLSVPNLKTLSNSSDVDKHKHTDGLKVKVYVLNKDGKPLMPCKPAKARHLLRNKKAKVVSRKPFTIQLNWDCENNTQPIKLGIDAGYLHVGFSAITDTKELISGELTMRKNISKLIEQKSNYRRTRRSKLWHRETRFDNRVKSKKKGWLAPSMQHKLQTHIKLIDKLKKILPINKTIIEVATFDQQKMQNPEISGIEYQQGELQGYEIKNYLLQKFGRKCMYCGKKNIPLEIEHIIPKSRGGSSRVSNLTIACRKCNLEKGSQTAEEFGYPKIQKQAKKTLKSTPFMNIVRKMLVQQINAEETFGYITKYGRIKYNLDKSHINDAFVIAEGITQDRCKPYSVTQTRRNNRKLQTNRKGYKPSIRRQRYKLQPNDLVKYKNKIQKSKGVFSYGKWVRLEDGTNANINKVELINYGKGLQFN